MDDGRFDAIARRLGRGVSRRRGLRAALGAGVAALGLGRERQANAGDPGKGRAGAGKDGRATTCLTNAKICARNSDCCSQYCLRSRARGRRSGAAPRVVSNRCQLAPNGTPCTAGKWCVSGVCTTGVCGPAGPPPADVCASGCRYSSIQAAIDAATPGATITVGAGEFTESLVVDKDVNLLGAGPGPRPDPTQKPSDFPVFSGGRAGTNPAAAGSIATIIKAPTGKRVLEVKATRTIGVTGFLLFGGDIGGSYPNNFTFGGTIFNAGTLTLADCIVINGKAYVGGNIANGGTLVIDNSAVVGGKTSGGIYSFAGGIYTGDGSTLRLLAQSSAVSGSYSAWIVWANSATGVGGIYADGATVSMKDEGWLSYNSSSGVGGLFAGSNVTAGTLTIGGCSSDTGGNVCTNKVVHVANNDAGGINVQQGTTLTIQGATEISGNSNTVRGGDGGGGVMIFGNATIKGNAKITGNSTAGSGGNYGGGIAISSPGTLDLKDNVEVSGNTADIGGGLYVGQGVASLSIGSNVRIKNNSARGTGNAGGGVSVYDDTSPATFGASATNVTGNTNANGTCPNYAQNNGATCATLV